MMSTLSVVTIGQAPRVDVTPELAQMLGSSVDIIEHGALDLLNEAEIAALAPPAGADGVLTSRLRNGSSAVFTHEDVNPLVQAAISRGEAADADATLLICSSHFPPFQHERPLFFLEPLAHAAMAGLLSGYPQRRLGVVRPLADQTSDGEQGWRSGSAAHVTGLAAASPYTGTIEEIAAAAVTVAPEADVVVLDCIGYGAEMAATARAACADNGHPVPVVTVRSLGARLLAALLGK